MQKEAEVDVSALADLVKAKDRDIKRLQRLLGEMFFVVARRLCAHCMHWRREMTRRQAAMFPLSECMHPCFA